MTLTNSSQGHYPLSLEFSFLSLSLSQNHITIFFPSSLCLEVFSLDQNNKMSTSEACNASFWTKEENKAFENALAIYGDVDQWENIAAAVPGKTVEDIILQYRALVDDVATIEADLVPLPNYVSSSQNSSNSTGGVSINREGNQTEQAPSGSYNKETRAKPVGQRRRGRPWTEEEHRHFLEGMEKYGRGDWRSISRFHVVSKTPTQVASHAQKYFQRLKNEKRKRGASIHDITSAETGSPSAGQSPTARGRSKVRRASIHDNNCVDTGSTSAGQRPTARGRSEVVKRTNNSSTSKRSLFTGEMKDPGGIILESQPLAVCGQAIGPVGLDYGEGPSIPQMPFTAQPTRKAAVGTFDSTDSIDFTSIRASQQLPVSAQMMGFAGVDFTGSTSIPQTCSARQSRVSGERFEVPQLQMRGHASSQTLLLSGQMSGTGGIELTSVRTSQLMRVSAQMIGTGSDFVGPISLPEMPLSALPTGAAGLGTSTDYAAGIETGYGASELPPFPEQLTSFAEDTSFSQMTLHAQPTGAAALGTSSDYATGIDTGYGASELLPFPEQLTTFAEGTSFQQMTLTAQPTGAAGVGPIGYQGNLIQSNFAAFIMGFPPAPLFPTQMPVTSSVQMPMSLPQPTSIMYSVRETRYGLFTSHPLLNVAPRTYPMPPPPDQN